MDTEELIKQIKLNCNISDANFWGYYSMCGLLMDLRELYRNEHCLMPWNSIPNEKIFHWIEEKEKLWKYLEDAELCSLAIDGAIYDPFDVNGLNDILKDFGLFYGSGYSTLQKPSFFLARLYATKEIYDYQIYYTSSELCRDLSAPPSMLQGRCIYIRRDALRTIIWDKFQELAASQCEGLLKEMFLPYDIKKTDMASEDLFKKVERVAHAVSELLVLHEIGEVFEDDYSDEWFEVLSNSRHRSHELYIRGVKDILADTSDKGPLKAAVDQKDRPLLILYMVFLDKARKGIFPEIKNAFQQFTETDEWSLIENARVAGYERAIEFRDTILKLWEEDREITRVVTAIKQSIETSCKTQNV
ncbi:hypothetical protein M1N02_02525 [Thermodesulfovibrionales bacterium]|nr:hypothetical protein [Thermodesulfovibrionales bacterium]MCL0040970.1 hypothetical protein [Thermodesulfovibrionales bacterium]MCL0066464.1 hypothetical protein [Thermodesulfovibrionales bacterium]